jgi:hypothetical protein
MKEETDIVIIRELAKKLAYFDIKLDEDFSFMVIHPYIDNSYVQSDGALCNILENQKAYTINYKTI